MRKVIGWETLARKRARKRYEKDFADVRAKKKLALDCYLLLDELTKSMRLARESRATTAQTIG